jgi:hypothetical protein
LIIRPQKDGSITISDDRKPVYNIKAKLVFKRDRGHGGGSYVDDVVLEVTEVKIPFRPPNKEDYHKWKNKMENER